MAFELDIEGGAEVLKVLAAGAIKDLADQIAGQAGEGATVRAYTTDRAAAAVSVPADAQAIDGALTKAAAAVGLEVTAVAPRRSRAKARKASAKKGAAK